MQQIRPPLSRGFTLGELFAVLLILTVTAFIIFPVVTNCGLSKGKMQRNQCMSNLKQIGLAALTYAQNYDETLPPAIQTAEHDVTIRTETRQPEIIRLLRGQTGTTYQIRHEPHVTLTYWLGQNEIVSGSMTNMATLTPQYGGFLLPYLNAKAMVTCPEKLDGQFFTYRSNDLAGGESLKEFTRPVVTVLAMDGETVHAATGHKMSTSEPNAWENTEAMRQLKLIQEAFGDAVVHTAPTRHEGGANYLFADGHVRWSRPQTVFFPWELTGQSSHIQPKTNAIVGPDPGASMIYNGYKYTATFHIR